MSQGTLRCVGSPLFLKSKYGSGYSLTITKKPKTISVEESLITDKSDKKYNAKLHEETVISNKIISLIKNKMPNSKLKTNLHNEISFLLPAEDSGKFAELFEILERAKHDLHILNIGISVTTVEEIFLKYKIIAQVIRRLMCFENCIFLGLAKRKQMFMRKKTPRSLSLTKTQIRPLIAAAQIEKLTSKASQAFGQVQNKKISSQVLASISNNSEHCLSSDSFTR